MTFQNLKKYILQLQITNYIILSTSSFNNDGGINCLLNFVQERVRKLPFNFLLYYPSKQSLEQRELFLKLLVKKVFSMKGFLFFQDINIKEKNLSACYEHLILIFLNLNLKL